MFNLPQLEVSTQQLASQPNTEVSLAPSRPLHELVADAPGVPWPEEAWITFPFANDECTAPYFKQLQARVETPGYQSASNRVALLVGESALAANLQYIPEETIILADRSSSMLLFMARYIDALRSMATPEEWMKEMAIDEAALLSKSPHIAHMRSQALAQIKTWRTAGYASPFVDPAAYSEASYIARRKAIIPWCADIKSAQDVAQLGNVLRTYNATVTMMNLTNVMPFASDLATAEEGAEVLAHLPVTDEAPILTTTPGQPDPGKSWWHVSDTTIFPLEMTGPFFGLKNLAEAGGNITLAPYGPLVQRRYATAEELGIAEEPLAEF